MLLLLLYCHNWTMKKLRTSEAKPVGGDSLALWKGLSSHYSWQHIKIPKYNIVLKGEKYLRSHGNTLNLPTHLIFLLEHRLRNPNEEDGTVGMNERRNVSSILM